MDLGYQIVFNPGHYENPMSPKSFLCLFGLDGERKIFLEDQESAILGFLKSEWAYLLLEGRGLAVLEDIDDTYKFIDAKHGFTDAQGDQYENGIIIPHPFEESEENFSWLNKYNNLLYQKIPELNNYDERFEVFDVLVGEGVDKQWCHAMSYIALVDNYYLREHITQIVAYLAQEIGLNAPPLVFFNSHSTSEISHDFVVAKKCMFRDGELDLFSGGYLEGYILGHYNPV